MYIIWIMLSCLSIDVWCSHINSCKIVDISHQTSLFDIPHEIALRIQKKAIKAAIKLLLHESWYGRSRAEIKHALDTIYLYYIPRIPCRNQKAILQRIANKILYTFHQEMPVPNGLLRVLQRIQDAHHVKKIKPESVFARPTIFGWHINGEPGAQLKLALPLTLSSILVIESHDAISLQGLSAINEPNLVRDIFIDEGPLQQIICKFRLFHNLEKVIIIKNRLKTVHAKEFSGCQKLKQIILHNNNIQKIHIDAFRNCPALKFIDLSNNHITLQQQKCCESAYPNIRFLWQHT